MMGADGNLGHPGIGAIGNRIEFIRGTVAPTYNLATVTEDGTWLGRCRNHDSIG
jgi:hypothetical protein